MTTSGKLATTVAAVLAVAIASSLATAYLMRPPMPANADPFRPLTGGDVPPELDRMAEPRRGIVDYVRGATGTSGERRDRLVAPARGVSRAQAERTSPPPRSRDSMD